MAVWWSCGNVEPTLLLFRMLLRIVGKSLLSLTKLLLPVTEAGPVPASTGILPHVPVIPVTEAILVPGSSGSRNRSASVTGNIPVTEAILVPASSGSRNRSASVTGNIPVTEAVSVLVAVDVDPPTSAFFFGDCNAQGAAKMPTLPQNFCAGRKMGLPLSPVQGR